MAASSAAVITFSSVISQIVFSLTRTTVEKTSTSNRVRANVLAPPRRIFDMGFIFFNRSADKTN